MGRRFFHGFWMFSPATVLCILGFLGCIALQVKAERDGWAAGQGLADYALIYLDYLQAGFLLAALICSAISIGKLSLSAPGPTLSGFPAERRRPRQGPAALAPAAFPVAHAEQGRPPAAPPPSEPARRERANVVRLQDYRRRGTGSAGSRADAEPAAEQPRDRLLDEPFG